MTTECWDPDQAVMRGPLDSELEGQPSPERYGVTGREEVDGEPLEVALAQEESDQARSFDLYDQWLLVEYPWEPDGARDALEDGGPEAAAMHIETP